ncbi:polyamine-modulated factor 1-binding protein 1-like isoform X2 [Bufo bufo]|uniref:polyamine-modulated factor 1-binding protein 1-like isoform X2 n=1 Tax=Bufo bufo TaxID=8384 RepID=UPI001ABE483C|nr:polyamine-modulated factor 1-binding protein 1-like isoform X2 [Bufo bufo]
MNGLNMEVGILKSELHRKSREMEALEAQVQQQKESLHRASDKLKDTKRAAASKIHDKESKREALQKELLKAQNQYSACYDELLHRDKLLHKLKEENIRLTEQIIQQSQDISKTSEERKRLELKLAVVTERHKTAQQEVNNRDQIILQLKTDFKTSQEKYFGTQEELSLQEAEVSRLQQRIKSLQSESRELWEKCNDQEDRLNQAEKAKQQLLHQEEIHLGQIQNYTMIVEKLQSDLDQAKHSHTADLERWNQKASLMQKDLISESTEHRADLLKIQECKDKILSLEENLERAELVYQNAKTKMETQEETIKKQNLEMKQLQEEVQKLEKNKLEGHNQARASESALEQYKKKYRATVDTMKSLEKHLGALQQHMTASASETTNKKETIQSLEAEILILQHRCKDKTDQVETFEHLIDQLTGELHSSKDDVKLSKEQCQQYGRQVETLTEKIDLLQKQILKSQNDINNISSKSEDYKSAHSHTNDDYEAQSLHLQECQKDMENLKKQVCEKTAKVEEYQQVIERQNAEAVKALDQQRKYAHETEELEKTLRSLHTEILTGQQKHKAELHRLEQLEAELKDCKDVCAQKDQAISKRDDLLRKSEADLLQARKGIKEKAAEAEHLDSVVKKLEERIQDAEKKTNQKEKESVVLRAEIKDLGAELQDVHKLYRETAQELASQEEKLLLLESSLKATEEQLSEQIAETVRQEQTGRKSQTDLKTLKEHLTASEREKSECKEMLENIKAELTTLKAQHQLTVQESLQLQQTNHKYEIENTSVRENARNLQQQVENFETLVKGLREELIQGQLHHQDGQTLVDKLKKQASDLECEVENLKSKKKSDSQLIKEQENRLIRLEDEIRQLQEKSSSSQSDLLEAQAQMKMLLLNVSTAKKQMKYYTTQAEFYEETIAKLQEDLEHSKRHCRKSTKNLESAEQNLCDLRLEITLIQANYKQTVEQLNVKTEENSVLSAEVKRLKEALSGLKQESKAELLKLQHRSTKEEVANLQNELKTTEKKYITAQRELEILRQALEATQTDNSRLHKESEFVAANVNQWIKDQKFANENLGEKICEQNQLLAHLTEERDIFQKREEMLSAVVTRLKSEMEEMTAENEQLKENGVEQRALLSELKKQLETLELEHTNLLEKNLEATEDMQVRLKNNITSIHFLSQKLAALNQENGHLQQKLDEERLRNHQLDLQLETCNQTLSNLFTHLKAEGQKDVLHKEQTPNNILCCNHKNQPRCDKPLQILSQCRETKDNLKRSVEQLVGKDSEEKSCWNQHIAELSALLQDK